MATEGLTLDTGVFIAAEKGSRAVWAIFKEAMNRGARLTVPAPVLAQVWRDPPEVRIATLLKSCEVEGLDEASAKAVGKLLGWSRTHDVVDAAVVAGAVGRHDLIVTSDPIDIRRLLAAAGSGDDVIAI